MSDRPAARPAVDLTAISDRINAIGPRWADHPRSFEKGQFAAALHDIAYLIHAAWALQARVRALEAQVADVVAEREAWYAEVERLRKVEVAQQARRGRLETIEQMGRRYVAACERSSLPEMDAAFQDLVAAVLDDAPDARGGA